MRGCLNRAEDVMFINLRQDCILHYFFENHPAPTLYSCKLRNQHVPHFIQMVVWFWRNKKGIDYFVYSIQKRTANKLLFIKGETALNFELRQTKHLLSKRFEH